MACPITVTKFVGTVSLGLLTGLSYSTATVTIPALKLLPTATYATRALREVKRRTRKHALQLSNLTNGCILFAYCLSSKRRKHPYLIWMVLTSSIGSFGVDFLFNRSKGFVGWTQMVVEDLGLPALAGKKKTTKKEEDLVVVEPATEVNGEIVEQEMEQERKLQRARAWLSGLALAMGIVGLWGDGA
ncbi:hypothetical protein Plec18167_005266 [Paecilomyces lecythidis]|uniref:Uncharacterized protein n=1 Tax=Paecilomyces lecythidis TaxID=3004212 RepID=A0ABR3XJS8_9EURO